MSFTRKNLQSSRRGMTFLKGATLFFLGMSCVLFITKAFEITPIATDVRGYFRTLVLTLNGDNASATGIVLDGGNGDGTFNGTVSATTISGTNIKGTTITGTTICLGTVCRTTWPTGGTASTASLWSTGSTGAIYYTSGNVGIGTANPLSKLHVIGGLTSSSIYVDTPDGISIGEEYIGALEEIQGIFTSDGNSLSDIIGARVFGSGWLFAGDNVRVSDVGNVGIGTTSPQSKLHVNGGIRGLNDLMITDDDVTYAELHTNLANASLLLKTEENYFSIINNDSSTYDVRLRSDNDFPMLFGTNNIERMRIDGNGNVGIGTSSPSAKLEVVSGDQKIQAFTTYTGYIDSYGDTITDYTTNINLSASAEMSGFSLGQDKYISSYDNYYYKRNYIYSPNNPLTLSTNYLNKFDPMLVITTGGKVGIGTSSPTAKLTVEGGIKPIGTGASPCADTTNYPTGTMFYNSTSNYYCYCSGTTAQQLHSPSTTCSF